MNYINNFFNIFIHYCSELWFVLAVGFLISGFFYKFIPTSMVERHLGNRGLRPIFIASLIGTFLPVCCIGSLPIAVTLRKKGAALGAVLAFMVATPATSISALVVCWKLMGLTFTIFIFFAIIVMAIIMGGVVNNVPVKPDSDLDVATKSKCCQSKLDSGEDHPEAISEKIKGAVYYAFVTIPKEMGGEILIGIGVASFITVFEPLQHLIREYLTGAVGYIFILVVGLVTYVCSTASVPMADALIHSGLTYGQALCYLLVGPITSYSTILVIRKDFGKRILFVYLSIIASLSLFYGLLYDAYLY